MHPDKFWKYFWSLLGLCLVAYTVSVAGLLYTHSPDDASLAKAVGDSYDPLRDPFQKTASPQGLPLSDYLYRDSLPLGFEDWSWEVSANWRSTERAFEGSYSLRAEFQKPLADVRAHTPNIALSPYGSLSLAVFPESVNELYLELYDIEGNSIAREPIGWYAPDGKLVQNRWNVVSIPLANLTATTSEMLPKRIISGFSLSAEAPGVAFIDAVRLEKEVASHPRFEAPAIVQ